MDNVVNLVGTAVFLMHIGGVDQCDFSSRQNTLELYQAFQTSPDVRIKLFLGDEERVDYDLNRASSKHSNFYKRLLLFMTQINLKQFQKEKGFSPNQFLPCTDDLKVNSRLWGTNHKFISRECE